MIGKKETPKTQDPFLKQPLKFKTFSFGDVVLVRGREGNWFERFVRWGIRSISESLVDHAVIMGDVENGDQMAYESDLTNGNHKFKFKKYIDDRTGLLIFRNKFLGYELTAQTLLRAAVNGRVGRRYDLPALLNFIKMKMGKEPDPDKTKQNFCSEYIVECYNCAGIISTNKPSWHTAPGDLKKFFLSVPGKKAGWKLIDHQNIGKELWEVINK